MNCYSGQGFLYVFFFFFFRFLFLFPDENPSFLMEINSLVEGRG